MSKERGRVVLGDVLEGGRRVVSIGRIGNLVAWSTRNAAGEYEGERGPAEESVELAISWGAEAAPEVSA